MSEGHIIASDDFARRFSMRSNRLMWLLGAGASASAGISTAWNMIWEFKQQLYISQRRIQSELVSDLSSPLVQSRLQSFIDSLGKYPQQGAPDEYAELFEAAYGDEIDRRTYIDAKLKGAKPSYGHVALATLMKSDRTRIIWTTNFDALIADASAKVFGSTSNLTTVALDSPEMARQAIQELRWPVEIKLHGDFRSQKLKNTGNELQKQDLILRKMLVTECERSGLIVAGYSGRDESVMQALDDALDCSSPFPAGLFWMHRGKEAPLSSVSNLINKARLKGVNCGLVVIENFDEALRDLVRVSQGLDTSVLDAFAQERSVRSPVPKFGVSGHFPIIRLNALPITLMPTTCRLIGCNIGGTTEVEAAIMQSGARALAARTKEGVIAFGSDAELRRAFGRFDITSFALKAIEPDRLRRESQEHGLVMHAISHAISGAFEMDIARRGRMDVLVPRNPSHSNWQILCEQLGSIAGTVQHHSELQWSEGIVVKLDWTEGRPWIVFEPRINFVGLCDSNRGAAADFSRERTARRYNKQLDAVIKFWGDLLGQNTEILALGVTTGVDACFSFGRVTAFSRRQN